MIGHYVKRRDGGIVRMGGEASFDQLVCVHLNPFTLVSPGGLYVWRGDFQSLEFEMLGRVPDGIWWPCVRKALGTAGLLEPPLHWPRKWHCPELILRHDYPACATFGRGPHCTCDVHYE